MDPYYRSVLLESPWSRSVLHTGSAWRRWRRQPGRGHSNSQAWRAVESTGEASNPDRERAGEKKSRQEARRGVFRSRVNPHSTPGFVTAVASVEA